MFPHDPKHAAPPVEGHGSLLVLALLALVVGAAAGLVGAIFRLTLEQADRLRDALIAWAQGEKIAGFLFVVATCAAAALIAAWLVRRFSPHATHRWRARFSCLRSWYGGLSSVSRSRRSVHQRRPSQRGACFSVMRLISMSMRLPMPAPKRRRSSSCWVLRPV